jgi:MYXO-CTERM domain-containing protein
MQSTHRSFFPIFVSLGAMLGTLALTESEADAAVAYVRSTVGAPWGSTSNEQAMDTVFGVGAWDDLRYETVVPAALFSPTYSFIYMEGSDSNALELQAFLMANQAALEAWVSAGGDLFLNAGPNEGANQAWGFGGVTLNNGDFPTDPGMAANPADPIWTGPFLPTSPAMFTGGSYAHASVSGPGLVPMIVDSDGGNPQLAFLPAFGAGKVMFGGLTTANFWSPAAESQNLRANIIALLAGEDSDMDGLIDALDNCPMVPNPGQADMDMDAVGDVCDPCPMSALNDADEDTVCDDIDNCIDLANPTQVDGDMDMLGDMCDACPTDPDNDIDGDMLCADEDNCPADTNFTQNDVDADGVGDLCDDCPDDALNDPDADGVCGMVDNCPDDANADQADADMDGSGDACDPTPNGEDETTGGGSSGGDGTGGTPSDDSGGTPGDSTGGTPGDGSGSTGAMEDFDYNPGCGCRSTPSGGTAWWAVPLIALGLRRRRRD